MTDFNAQATPHRRYRHRRTVEFYFYFTMIFLVAMPSASFAWARDVIRHRTLNLLGPLARSWAEAERMTPLIFSV